MIFSEDEPLRSWTILDVSSGLLDDLLFGIDVLDSREHLSRQLQAAQLGRLEVGQAQLLEDPDTNFFAGVGLVFREKLHDELDARVSLLRLTCGCGFCSCLSSTSAR